MYKGGLKSLYDNIISAFYAFFDQLNPNTETHIEEACVTQGRQHWKINLIR